MENFNRILSAIFLTVCALSPVAGYNTTPYLLNGTVASPGMFPFFAHIRSGGRIESAFLISDQHVLAKAEIIKN